MASTDLVGRCGIYCGACPVYLGARGNEEAARHAKLNWKVPEDEIRCNGCSGLTPECYGNHCGYRECMEGYDYCSQCPEYQADACEKLSHFEAWFNSLGESLKENLGRIEAGETGEWLGEQAERWSCPGCGSPVFWEQTRCPECGKPLK